MSSLSKTRAAAEYAALHSRAELTRLRAVVLLEQLAAWELAADGNGRLPGAAVAGLLRSLGTAVRDLVGAGWLDAMADDPDVAAFTAMQVTASPPELDTIDETCSRVLWARFRQADADRENAG